MALSRAQIRLLGWGGFVMLFLITPLAGVYALDYQLVRTEAPPGNPPLYPYGELEPTQQAAVEGALTGDGPWYRTRAAVPFDRMPILVRYDDRVYAIGLTEGYHWGSWRGKLPLLTGAIGLVSLSITIRSRIRSQGAVPIE